MCKFWKWTSFWLVIIGALNWGLFGLLKIDLVSLLLGEMSIAARTIYIIIGLCAILYASIIYICGDDCKY